MRERRLRHVLRENRRVAGDAPPILPEALRNKVLYRARRMRHKAKLAFITGTRSLDEYDAYVEELYTMGLQLVLDAKNDAYSVLK